MKEKKQDDLVGSVDLIPREEKKKKKKRLFFFLFWFVLTPVIFVSGFYLMNEYVKNEHKKNVVDGVNFNPEEEPEEKEEDDRKISIPGYSGITINSTQSQVPLINPEVNNVLFKYTVMIDNQNVFETDLFPPGKAILFDARERLGPGVFTGYLLIETFDLETQAQYNGAKVNISISIANPQ